MNFVQIVNHKRCIKINNQPARDPIIPVSNNIIDTYDFKGSTSSSPCALESVTFVCKVIPKLLLLESMVVIKKLDAFFSFIFGSSLPNREKYNGSKGLPGENTDMTHKVRLDI